MSQVGLSYDVNCLEIVNNSSQLYSSRFNASLSCSISSLLKKEENLLKIHFLETDFSQDCLNYVVACLEIIHISSLLDFSLSFGNLTWNSFLLLASFPVMKWCYSIQGKSCKNRIFSGSIFLNINHSYPITHFQSKMFTVHAYLGKGRSTAPPAFSI